MIRLAATTTLSVLAICGAARAATELVVATADGPTSVRVFAAPSAAPRPIVLLLHGRDGIKPLAVYEAFAEALVAGGIDAWLFSYYSPADAEIMLSPGRERHLARYRERFRAWAEKVDEIAAVASTQQTSSGRIGLIGLSNGGFLAVAAAALEPRIAGLVVFYGGFPDGARGIKRLPPLLALHGEADEVIPAREGRALVERARELGAAAELVVYPGAGHGFDFDPNSAAGRNAHARAVEFLALQLGAR
jgi:carboxymethylenebutenolidase